MKTLIAKLITVANSLDEKGYHKDANFVTKLAYDFARPDKQDIVDDSLAMDIDFPNVNPNDGNADDDSVNEFQLDASEEMPVEPNPMEDEDKELKIIRDFINLIKGNDVDETMGMIEDEVKPEPMEEPMAEQPMPKEDLSQEYSAAPEDIFAPKLSFNLKKTILANYKDLGL
jgi:hypothetical protein